MEVKQPPAVTTVLEPLVDRYESLRATIEAMEQEKDELRDRLLQMFQSLGTREIVDSKNRKVSVSTMVRKSISYKEAEATLAPTVLARLTRESVAIVLSVRLLKREA